MKRHSVILLLLPLFTLHAWAAPRMPKPADVLAAMHRANSHFLARHPDPTAATFVKKERPSNLWTRGVYFEGLTDLNRIDPQPQNVAYMARWAHFHRFMPRNGITTRDADDYCCSQSYLDLYVDSLPFYRDQQMIAPTVQLLDRLVSLRQAEAAAGEERPALRHSSVEDWTWIDAIQMGLPVFSKLARIRHLQGDASASVYTDQGWRMYEWTRNVLAGGLFNPREGLWWRDADFTPPYQSPNGKNCYWSRGNGWVYAALVRAIDAALLADNAAYPDYREKPRAKSWTPLEFEPHLADYRADFLAMTEALVRCQRADGFWNVDLLDASNFGGKELTGTALFIYGMAWGVRHGILPEKRFLPIVARTWKAMVSECLHPSGFLGYVQGTGKEPKDSQPVGYDVEPDFDDFGLGCFLLAGAEVYRLALR